MAVLLADLVATSERVGATPARSRKVAALADLLRSLAPDEAVPAVAILSGEPRQGRIGIGWATLAAVSADPAPEPTLTIADLDRALDGLATLGGPGSAGARSSALATLFSRATGAEADFLRRLLVGELRQGALEGVMVDAVARAAGIPAAAVRRAAMLAGDLPQVAALALGGGEEALSRVGLTLLCPVQPMLAASSPDVGAALEETGPASVEWKLDGARIQVHREGDRVGIYTRSLRDVTDRLGGIAAVVRTLPSSRFILDGEAMGWGEDERPDRFQDTMSRFGRHASGEGPAGTAGTALGARFFDCLHLDGEDLLDRPLQERVAALEQVAGPWRVPSIVTDDPAEASAFLEGAVGSGHEGVMIKAVDSPYEAGRRGGAWRKVKPVQTLDLVVLAAEWGHGRRRGWLSNLHLGAQSPDGPVMVGKTFKGLTDELLEWQTAELLAREVRREGITVYVRPELVVEIALDGVLASTRYPGGVALRFARVRRYRPDKGPLEADSIATVREFLAT
ncbi:MAG: ATP-dependent DNA ligase [Actinomycetota bacterium]|nr:ATP-dependent DNA ligase [Actinomycetota bacterium]